MRIDTICDFIKACSGHSTVIGGIILVPGENITLVIELKTIIKIYGYKDSRVWSIQLHKDQTDIHHDSNENKARLGLLADLFRKYLYDTPCPKKIILGTTLRRYIKEFITLEEMTNEVLERGYF